MMRMAMMILDENNNDNYNDNDNHDDNDSHDDNVDNNDNHDDVSLQLSLSK